MVAVCISHRAYLCERQVVPVDKEQSLVALRTFARQRCFAERTVPVIESSSRVPGLNDAVFAILKV